MRSRDPLSKIQENWNMSAENASRSQKVSKVGAPCALHSGSNGWRWKWRGWLKVDRKRSSLSQDLPHNPIQAASPSQLMGNGGGGCRGEGFSFKEIFVSISDMAREDYIKILLLSGASFPSALFSTFRNLKVFSQVCTPREINIGLSS